MAPTATAASGIGATSFTANWTSPGGTVTDYRLDVSTDIGFGSFVSGDSDLTVAGTSQIVAGLTASTPYYYRVRAYNAGGNSAYSNTANATTQAQQSTNVIANSSFETPILSAGSYQYNPTGGTWNFTGAAGYAHIDFMTDADTVVWETTELNDVKMVTINDTGTAPLVVSAIRISGADSNAFRITSGGTPFTLNPVDDTVHLVGIKFVGPAGSVKHAMLVIESNAVGSPATMALVGGVLSAVAEGAPMDATLARSGLADERAPFMKRSRFHRTASASHCVPSWNMMPGLSSSTSVLLSG